MPAKAKFFQRWRQNTALAYHRLLSANALPAIALLGLLTGLITGLICSLFRLSIEVPLQYLLPSGDSESFESLAWYWQVLLPIAGALILGLIYQLLSFNNKQDNRVGIVHVLERLNHHHGILPWRNAALQFFSGVIALISGQSGGREGPAIHLGATTGSLLGQNLQQPNNITRILVGCGTAAAIAASFNTPIAGVIFAMEVIMMEYSIAGFTPIILAAAGGTFISHLIFGNESVFNASTAGLINFWELPMLGALGICCGLTAACFIYISRKGLDYRQQPILLRFLFAGCVTALLAYFSPAILGTGYDTVIESFDAELGVKALMLFACLKLLATAISCGMGMPIGIIGPNLVIGASVGAIFYALAEITFLQHSDSVLYVLVGMGAMMAAVMNAPLAALLAIIEMSDSLHIALPGMLAIVIACICNSSLSPHPSVHQAILNAIGARLKLSPIMRSLQRIGLNRIESEAHIQSECRISLARAKALSQLEFQWLVIKDEHRYQAISRLNFNQALEKVKPQDDEINLLSLSSDFKPATLIQGHVGLDQVWLKMQEKQVELALLEQYHRSLIISKSAIETYLQSHHY